MKYLHLRWEVLLWLSGGLATLGAIAYSYRDEIKYFYDIIFNTNDFPTAGHSSRSEFDGREMTQCCICLVPLVESKVHRLPCNHLFHQKCINEVFKNEDGEPKCPLCRRNVPPLNSQIF